MRPVDLTNDNVQLERSDGDSLRSEIVPVSMVKTAVLAVAQPTIDAVVAILTPLQAVAAVTPVADGTYTVGIGTMTNGTITVSKGIITAVQEAT